MFLPFFGSRSTRNFTGNRFTRKILILVVIFPRPRKPLLLQSVKEFKRERVMELGVHAALFTCLYLYTLH